MGQPWGLRAGHLEIRGPRPLRRKALGGSERGLGSPGNLRVGAFGKMGSTPFLLALGPSRVWVGPGSLARLGPDIPPAFFLPSLLVVAVQYLCELSCGLLSPLYPPPGKFCPTC